MLVLHVTVDLLNPRASTADILGGYFTRQLLSFEKAVRLDYSDTGDAEVEAALHLNEPPPDTVEEEEGEGGDDGDGDQNPEEEGHGQMQTAGPGEDRLVATTTH